MANQTLTPWFGQVTLTSAFTPYQLSDLISKLSYAPSVGHVPRAQYLAIQADWGAGGANFFLGGPDMTGAGNVAANFGSQIVATQTIPFGDRDGNLVRLDHIWLMCDTAGQKMNVIFITR